MISLTTETPPVIREENGKWFIIVTDGTTEMKAPIGAWFAAQFMTRVVVPKLALDAMREPHPKSMPPWIDPLIPVKPTNTLVLDVELKGGGFKYSVRMSEIKWSDVARYRVMQK